jgi:serine/threonine-protein phosphatase 5
MCHIQILKPQLAVADLKKVLALEPQNAQVRKELESTQKLVRKIEFEKAIEVEEEKSAVDRCLEIIAEGASLSSCSLFWLIKVDFFPDKGACEVEKTYEGPKLETTDDGKYKVTVEFIRSMIQWFKDGKTLPRRYAWEIVLGAHEHFMKEESLVDVKVENDVTIDVIGDVHGANCSLCLGRSPTDSVTGQFYDVVHLLSLTGEPSSNHILLMNGDLVDRGSWSIEVILTAFAFKCEYT